LVWVIVSALEILSYVAGGFSSPAPARSRYLVRPTMGESVEIVGHDSPTRSAAGL